MRFQLPHGYKAFMPYIRVRDLSAKGDLYKSGIKVARLHYNTHRGIIVEHMLHAPDVRPEKSEYFTIFLYPEKTRVVEWYAGFDISLFPPDNTLDSQWVYLGGDLEFDNSRRHRG